MTQWKKPLPTIVGETKPYWDACKRGELLLQRCDDCEEYQFYPRGICADCWSTNIRWVPSSGRGTVWSYTITYQNRTPGFAGEVPYVVAMVELEGAVKVFTNIVECDPKDVRIGMPVQVTFVRATPEVTIPYFKPAQ